MQKIPTALGRTQDRRHVTPAIAPGCEWITDPVAGRRAKLKQRDLPPVGAA